MTESESLPELAISTSQESGKLIIQLDSQVLSKIQSCNQLAYYRHGMNIEPLDYDNESLDIGLLIHHGMETHYRNKHLIKYADLIPMVSAAMETYAPAKTNLPTKMVGELIAVYMQYAEKYRDESWVIKRIGNEPLVERTFAVKMYEDDEVIILYTGVTDLIVEFNPLNFPVDHKTFGSYFPPAVLSNQFNGYIWAAGAKNLIVNRIGVRSKKGHFDRVTVSKTESQLEEWKNNSIDEVLRHLEQMKVGKFRRNYEACTNYGGCRYARLCNADPRHRNYLIKNEYKEVEPWNPLTRD